jgi:raffinose/stachyose/melibiose transport system permease protein
MRITTRINSFLINFFLLVFSFTCIFPVIWLFYSSLKSQREFARNVIGFPQEITFDNFAFIFNTGRIPGYMWNTLRNTTLTVFLIIVFSFIVGYFLARYKFRGRNLLYVVFVAGMLMPIHALIVPMYVLFIQFDLNNRWFTLLLPYVSFGLPLAIFLVESYVRSLPKELEEAAAIDGAKFNRVLFTIVMPLVTPILVTVAIISFFNAWNEFLFAMILINDEALTTIPVGLARFQGEFTANHPRMMATMVVSIFIPMVLYFTFSKRIIEGMVTGAVKG